MKAYSYIRFSSAAQAAGDSYRRQVEASRRFAEMHGLNLDEDLTFKDLGTSAYRGKNLTEGALGAFIEAVDTGRVPKGSYLLVENLDRLSREQVSKAFSLFNDLLSRGVVIATMTDGQVFSQETINESLPSLMLSLMSMYRANEESEVKSRRLRSSWGNKRKNAGTKKLTAMCPSWLKLQEDRTDFDVIPEKAEVVQRIYQMYLEGMGKGIVAERLNEEGVRPLGKSNGWHHSYVSRLLQNKAVIGSFQPHKTTIVDGKRKDSPDGPEVNDYYPAIVDRDVYYRAQKQRQDRSLSKGRRGANFSNLFRGIVKCGECGSSMQMISKGNRWKTSAKPNQYLQCSGAKRKATNCHHRTLWPYHMTEYFITEGISDLDFSHLFPSITQAGVETLDTTQAELEASAGELNDVSEQIDNIVVALASRPDSLALLDKLDGLERQKGELENKRDKLTVVVEEARRQVETIEQRYATQMELLEQWRENEKDADLRSRLNRILSSNIEEIGFHPSEDGDDLGYIRVIFSGGERDWTLVVMRRIKAQNGTAVRGFYQGLSQPFTKENSEMTHGGEDLWWPKGSGPD